MRRSRRIATPIAFGHDRHPSDINSSDEQTQASWRVEILASELAELGSRGVEIIEYDTPGLKTENGIVDTGDALHAWFMDPARNTLGID